MGDAIIIFFFRSNPLYLQSFSHIGMSDLANYLNKSFIRWDIKKEATEEDQVALMNSMLRTKEGDDYLFRSIPQFDAITALGYSSDVFGVRIENKQIQLSYVCSTANKDIELNDMRNAVPTKINDVSSIIETLQDGFHAWKPGKSGLWLCAKKQDN